MTKTRVFLPGLAIAVLVGGIVGTILTVAIDLPQRPVVVTLGVVVGAVVAALIGFATALLITSGRRDGTDARPRLLVEPVETLDSPAGTGPAVAAGPDRPTQGAEQAALPAPAEVPDPLPAPEQLLQGSELATPGVSAPPASGPTGSALVRLPGADLRPLVPDEPDGPVLLASAVRLAGTAITRDAAIDEAGRLLVATGAVDEEYLAALHLRERAGSTFMGGELAIPHGSSDAAGLIRRPAVAVVRYLEAVGWSGNPVRFVIAIAAAGDEYVRLVSAVAEVFLDERAVERLEQATTAAEVVRALAPVNR